MLMNKKKLYRRLNQINKVEELIQLSNIEIKESENKIRTYKKQIVVLRARHAAVNATSKQKLHAGLELKNVEEELNKHEKILEERKKKWKKIGDLVLKLIGAKTLINKIPF